jgi:hypothetical protein
MAGKLFQTMKSEALKLLDQALATQTQRLRKLISEGNKLITLVDRQLPGIHRMAWATVSIHDRLLKKDQPVLRKMEKAIPANKKAMQAAAKELVTAGGQDAGKLSMTVNGEKISSETFAKVIKKTHVAASKDERPGVEIELTGPKDTPVWIKFSHHYDRKLRHKLAGKEKSKLESIYSDCELSEVKCGLWHLIIPGEGIPAKLTFSTAGFTAQHVFEIIVDNDKPIYFDLEIDYTAYRFVEIPYNGSNYTGYGLEKAIWGLPELKSLIEKFAAKQLEDTEKKPYIGNKSIKDGVKYYPHKGKEHALGYAVDIDFKNTCGNNWGEVGYIEINHEAQIKRYLACGASKVVIGNERLANKLGNKVVYDSSGNHYHHDHVESTQ